MKRRNKREREREKERKKEEEKKRKREILRMQIEKRDSEHLLHFDVGCPERSDF